MTTVKSPLADGTKFYVMDWVNNSILKVCNTLGEAKRLAKGEGYTYSHLGGNMPNAYVAADVKEWDYQTNDWSDTATARVLVYNPRF